MSLATGRVPQRSATIREDRFSHAVRAILVALGLWVVAGHTYGEFMRVRDIEMLRAMTDLLGFQPTWTGGAWVWDVRNLVDDPKATLG